MNALPLAAAPRRTSVKRWRLVAGILALGILALVLARAPIKLAVACVIGPVLGIFLLRKPSLGLYALAVTVPFAPFSINVSGAAVGASELVLAAVLAAWALRFATQRETHIVVPKAAWWLLMFIAACAASLLNAASLTAALPELAKWVEMWLVIVAVANLVEPNKRLPLCLAFLGAGVIEAGLGANQFLRQVGPEGFVLMGRYMRAYGTFEQPNPYGGYLGLLLPLAYGFVVTGLAKDDHAPSRRQTYLVVIGLSTAAALAVGLVMSWSRGALVGMAAGLLLVALSLGKRAWAIGLAALPLVALLGPSLLALAPAGFINRFLDAFRYMGQDLTVVEITDETFALVERAAHWQAAWRMFEMRPWLGIGIGQYPVIYPQVAVPRWQDPLGHAHNIYLHLLAEGGLLGLATHLMFLASWLAAAFRQAWKARGITRAIGIGALGMLGHLMAHHLVDNLYVHGMYLMMGVLIGLVSVSDRMSERREPSDWRE